MYCKKCGSIINQGESFCQNCGSKIETNVDNNINPVIEIFENKQQAQDKNNFENQNHEQSINNNLNQNSEGKKKIWIPIIVILLLIISVPLIISMISTNYSIANLRFYVNDNWERQDGKNVWYNEQKTCVLQILSDEMTDSVYNDMKNDIETSYSTKLKDKNINGQSWEYSSVAYEGYKVNIYSNNKNNIGYFILYSYKETDEECTKYLEKFEKTIKFKD